VEGRRLHFSGRGHHSPAASTSNNSAMQLIHFISARNPGPLVAALDILADNGAG
jgi:hypothetical protein